MVPMPQAQLVWGFLEEHDCHDKIFSHPQLQNEQTVSAATGVPLPQEKFLTTVNRASCLTSHLALLSLWLVLDAMYGVGRNLSHPVAQQLESLVEQFNPEYNRKNKQRTKEVWGPKLMKGKCAGAANCYCAQICKVAATPAHVRVAWCRMYVSENTTKCFVLARQCSVAARQGCDCSRACLTTTEVKTLRSMGS